MSGAAPPSIRQRALEAIRAEPGLTAPQVAHKLGISKKASANALHELATEGKLRRIGYVLPEVAEAIIAVACRNYGGAKAVTDEQVRYMTERFLCWKLPEDFMPDGGISAQRPNYGSNVAWEPRGTNLFSYDQAETMVRNMVAGLPQTDAKAALHYLEIAAANVEAAMAALPPDFLQSRS